MRRRGHLRSKPAPWFERQGGDLLRAEQALVQEHYPSLTFHVYSDSGMMHLTGDLILRSDCGVPTEIPIRIEFPVNYPNREPTAYDAASRFPTNLDRHILKDGQFCLWLPPCSPWSPTDPRRLLRFLDEVAVFLDRQLV